MYSAGNGAGYLVFAVYDSTTVVLQTVTNPAHYTCYTAAESLPVKDAVSSLGITSMMTYLRLDLVLLGVAYRICGAFLAELHKTLPSCLSDKEVA